MNFGNATKMLTTPPRLMEYWQLEYRCNTNNFTFWWSEAFLVVALHRWKYELDTWSHLSCDLRWSYPAQVRKDTKTWDMKIQNNFRIPVKINARKINTSVSSRLSRIKNSILLSNRHLAFSRFYRLDSSLLKLGGWIRRCTEDAEPNKWIANDTSVRSVC